LNSGFVARPSAIAFDCAFVNIFFPRLCLLSVDGRVSTF
jgi:hypothetical protein